MAVMMYDTSLRFQKLYQYLIASWTQEVLEWSGSAEVLIGVPVYDDEGVNYHYPNVENLRNSLLGIHAGLNNYTSLPKPDKKKRTKPPRNCSRYAVKSKRVKKNIKQRRIIDENFVRIYFDLTAQCPGG